MVNSQHASGCSYQSQSAWIRRRVLLLDPWGRLVTQHCSRLRLDRPVSEARTNSKLPIQWPDLETIQIPFGGPETMFFFRRGGVLDIFFWNTFSCTPTFDYRAVVELFFWIFGNFMELARPKVRHQDDHLTISLTYIYHKNQPYI